MYHKISVYTFICFRLDGYMYTAQDAILLIQDGVNVSQATNDINCFASQRNVICN